MNEAFQMNKKEDKLSVLQMKVIKLMQEGWACGIFTCTSGHTKIFDRGCLQKNGLGHGFPSESVKAQTIRSLENRGLIQKVGKGDGMVLPIEFKLTEKGVKTYFFLG